MPYIPRLDNGPISEAHPDFDKVASSRDLAMSEISSRRPLSENEASAALESMAGKVEHKARFKIEIAYQEERKHKAPSACSMTVWESGRRFHGGGDQSMFWCINAKDPTQGCGGLIPDSNIKVGVALCPHCKRTVNQTLLPVTRVGIFSAPKLAQEIHRVFRHLGGDADIYLKFHKSDLRGLTRLKAEGSVKKELAIYTLSRIIQDSLGGGDLVKKFEDFLTA